MSKAFLDRIPDPQTLRKFDLNQLFDLAKDLRQAIIDSLAKGEGHLGSSLGTVELSIALHYVFDTPKDLLVWDVGHQAYGHKMLTGRKSNFELLRQQGGISGFPNREESPYDAFGTGHAGTSISAVLGMALASQLQGQKNQHIAVIGDASIANGMAFEALNHLGTTAANVLIVLNDNSMGIDPSIGALKNYFDTVKKEASSLPNFFQNLNIDYSGPLDGHDLNALVSNLKRQKTQTSPRLLHVVTKKGKGLPLAENEQVTYHAPGKFDPITGKLNPANGEQKIKYQDVFGKTLEYLSGINSKIVAITPAMPTGSGLVELMQKFPDRCIDVGIAEQHAVTLAAGMATQGILPFCVIYSTFLQRAYDQVLHDVALQKLGVVFCIDRAGIVGHDGPTHHGVFDIAFLRCIPNLQIAAPRDAETLQNLLYTAQLGIDTPLAIRYPRGYSEIETCAFEFKKTPWGKGEQLKEGSEIAVLSLGTFAKTIALALENLDRAEAFAHFDLGFVKPLDEEMLHQVFKKYKAVILFDEGVKKGGVGTAVLEFATENGYRTPLFLEGVEDVFVPHGKSADLIKELELDAETIQKKLRLLLNKMKG